MLALIILASDDRVSHLNAHPSLSKLCNDFPEVAPGLEFGGYPAVAMHCVASQHHLEHFDALQNDHLGDGFEMLELEDQPKKSVSWLDQLDQPVPAELELFVDDLLDVLDFYIGFLQPSELALQVLNLIALGNRLENSSEKIAHIASLILPIFF